MGELAITGGTAIHTRPWKSWPIVDAASQRNVLDVLHSTRWAISALTQNRDSYEQKFGEAFAAFCGSRFGVPCASGTAALTIAMEALDIGPGDEVIVPGLTWVACPSSVVNLGAVPILVDVLPSTLCLDVDKVRVAITPRTKAIMAVHLYCSCVDLDDLLSLSAETGIPVIEDCSQAHGARWRGQTVGSLGRIGAFSTQQSKLLTTGEGGICVTDDEALFVRMQQLRADGRVYAPSNQPFDSYHLKQLGEIAGRNFCMSEIEGAIGCAGLARLKEQNDWRLKMAGNLSSMLGQEYGVCIVDTPEAVTSRAFYRLCFRVDHEQFGGATVMQIARALSHELGIFVDTIDPPLNAHRLYDPRRSPRLVRRPEEWSRYAPEQFALPAAESAYTACITMPHQCLLGDERDMEDIVLALRKLERNAAALRQLDP